VFLKTFGLLAPLVGGGLYVAGIFGGAAYDRDVARPPAEVMDALADLDITAQPGSPGTDSSRSGGVQPLFLVEREADRMIWTVMSGDKVAIRMTAIVQPAKAAGHSRVTAYVERGDAPDDFVSPAFRSTGIAMGLFGAALEGELNELTRVAAADPATCDALLARFEMENLQAGLAGDPNNLGQAVGNTAKIAIRLHAQEAELRRNGCDPARISGPDSSPFAVDEMAEGSRMIEDPSRIDPSATEIPAGVR
jgi:hypothetical protein